MAGRIRIVIMGAGGRDFHTFNTLYRHDAAHEVVAFTAAQIPGIAGRRYPPALAGPLYPDGIPIHDEAVLEALVREQRIDRVVFAYSDVAHVAVMNRASAVLAAGAEFVLPDPVRAMLPAPVPVIAICAVRTGCGKSQTARWIGRHLAARGLRVGVIRHPMPYGDLAQQAVLRRADIVLIAKANAATEADVATVSGAVRTLNPRAQVLRSASVVRLDDPATVRGRRVLVVEDGPTLTHGGMSHGAGLVAARDAGAAEIVDPRLSATPEIAAVFAAHPQLGPVLPAMGYSEAQLRAIATTIAASRAEIVVTGTPADLTRLLAGIRPVVRARYDYAELDAPGLGAAIDAFLAGRGDGARGDQAGSSAR